MPSAFDRPRAAYVHIPFCVSKCWYCDFSSYPGLEPIFADYVRALIIEIECSRRRPSRPEHDPEETSAPPAPVESVYLGGGTPTILAAQELSAILEAIRRHIGVAEDAEITIEANPGTVGLPKLTALRQAGFNRLSLGVQSLEDDFLRSIGRAHTRQQALDAYSFARQAGFDNVGIDLIFALPSQSILQWGNTLGSAIDLRPEHVSLYELSIEEGTRFSRMCAMGEMQPVDEDTQLAMYELAIQRLTFAGYEHYEVSNFARPGCRSRHNRVYWRNEPYYGFGAGATSYISGTRSRRIADPRAYVAAIESGVDAVESCETLGPRERLGETVVQGLRMLEGVKISHLKAASGLDPLLEFAPQVNDLVRRGLLEVTPERLRVTHQGLLLLNDVCREFV